MALTQQQKRNLKVAGTVVVGLVILKKLGKSAHDCACETIALSSASFDPDTYIMKVTLKSGQEFAEKLHWSPFGRELISTDFVSATKS